MFVGNAGATRRKLRIMTLPVSRQSASASQLASSYVLTAMDKHYVHVLTGAGQSTWVDSERGWVTESDDLGFLFPRGVPHDSASVILN